MKLELLQEWEQDLEKLLLLADGHHQRHLQDLVKPQHLGRHLEDKHQ
jgi:hypothetical protein